MEDSSSPAAAANAETTAAAGAPAKAEAPRRSRERERKRKARELQRKKKAAGTNNNTANAAKGKGSVIDAEELLAQTYPKNGAADASRKSSRPRRPTEKQWTGAWPAASGGIVGGGGGSGAVCVWSPEQEVLLAEALLAASDESGHVDMARVYQRVRDNSDAFLPGLTNTGVYEKMRRMKYRFSAIQHAGAGSDQSVFRSPHEARLFQIWLRTWDPAHKQRSSPSPSPPPPPPPDQQQQQQQGNGSVPDLSSKHISGILEGFVEALQPRLLALVDNMSHQRGPSEALITPCSVLRGCGGCSGSVGSCLMRRFEELKHEVRHHGGDLQEKRRKVGLAELKVLCQRLELLQEECKLCIAALESSSSSANPPPP